MYPLFGEDIAIQIMLMAGGAVVILYGLIMEIRDRMICTEEVDATCVEIAERFTRKSVVFAPVWKYYYKGKWYRTEDTMATSWSFLYSKGTTCTLLVSEKNPEKIRRKGNLNFVLLFLVGAAFIAFGLMWNQLIHM
ncbi:MAG: DUF3592 domain-containing protein [Oscillospiraceae bacterium]|nr:DUF3592 domain-containing protein [Oscillospiraceae bacterium]